MSQDDLSRVLDEIGRTLSGKSVHIRQDGAPRELDAAEREAVLGMLTSRAGVFDEGPREIGGAALRVINAPGQSAQPEYAAMRRLFVDIETFRPVRFEFSYEFPGMGDYAFDLVVE